MSEKQRSQATTSPRSRERHWKPATVVSTKGLRRRSQGFWSVGQRVMATVEPDLSIAGATQVVIEKGPFGCPSVVPAGMLRFDDEGAKSP